MSYTQDARPIGVTTPLGKDVLVLRGATVEERLSACFDIQLDLLSASDQIAPSDLLGRTVTVWLELSEGRKRFFNGYVNRFACIGWEQQGLVRYQATLVPWLWFLTRTSDCRIFQQMSVPDILGQVFSEAGFSDVSMRTSATYPTLEYCVQYRETHYAFVSRLMEQEGIYWYFVHEDGKHTLVLADDYAAHEAFPGYASIAYHADASAPIARDQDVIFDWSSAAAIRSGAFAHDDFDFEKPNVELLTTAAMAREHPYSAYEIYEYPGRYLQSDQGSRYAGIRMDEIQCDQQLVQGDSCARGLAVGHLFELTACPLPGQDGEYLVLSARHRLHTDAFQTAGAAAESQVYRASFTAMPAATPFRPARLTPKPIVQGPQTAVVVGAAGKEIDTDDYGRVKVQFHWDRHGQKNETSSCWIRVAQLWAGNQWGGMHIPRIGQEVVVDFLDGDPDRPLVTGRVYNAEQRPPWELPANMTQSGILSRSTEQGGVANANAIRMEDRKGSEELYLHAEKDMNTVVENNATLKIGFDKKDAGNQVVDIYNDRTTTLDQGADVLRLKTGDRKVILDQGNQELVLDMGNCSVRIKLGDQTTKLDAGKSTTEAMQSIELKVGQSSVTIDQTGVTIKGMMVQVEGQLQTQIKGLVTQINADGMLQAKGAITMIN